MGSSENGVDRWVGLLLSLEGLVMPWRTNFRTSAVLLVVTLGVAGAAWGSWKWMQSRPVLEEKSPPTVAQTAPVPAAPAKPKAKSTHPPIAALRDRMLTHYHGNAVHVFTSTPGFGLERMEPVYEQIPFQAPFISPGELDSSTQEPTPKPLQDVLAQSRTGFRDLKSLPSVRSGPTSGNFLAGPSNGFGLNMGGTVAHGLQLRLMDLVGLTDRENPRVYPGGQAFELVRVSRQGKMQPADIATLRQLASKVEKPRPAARSETRPLDYFERRGVEELQHGKDVFIRRQDKAIRMLGALRATAECLNCHTEAKAGELLGAFSYTFVDVPGTLFTAAKQAKGAGPQATPERPSVPVSPEK